MDVEEVEARMSERDRNQESVLKIKYKQAFERPVNRQVYWRTNYAVTLVVLGFVFLYCSVSIQDLLLCRVPRNLAQQFSPIYHMLSVG